MKQYLNQPLFKDAASAYHQQDSLLQTREYSPSIHDTVQNINDSTGSIEFGPVGSEAFLKQFYPKHSLFKEHLLQIRNQEYSLKKNEGQDWLFLVILGFIALIAILRTVYYKKLRIVAKAIYSQRHLSQIIRDSDTLNPVMKFYLQLNFLAMLSLTIQYLINTKLTVEISWLPNGFYLFGSLFIITAVIYLLRLGIVNFLGHLFKKPSLSVSYRLNIHIFSSISGIVMMPLLVILFFGSPAIKDIIVYVLIGGILLAWVTRLFKALFLGFEVSGFGVIYFFLYLCTLEILPYLMLYVLVMRF